MPAPAPRLETLKPGQEPASWNTAGIPPMDFGPATMPETYKLSTKPPKAPGLPWRVIVFTVLLVAVFGLVRMGMR